MLCSDRKRSVRLAAPAAGDVVWWGSYWKKVWVDQFPPPSYMYGPYLGWLVGSFLHPYLLTISFPFTPLTLTLSLSLTLWDQGFCRQPILRNKSEFLSRIPDKCSSTLFVERVYRLFLSRLHSWHTFWLYWVTFSSTPTTTAAAASSLPLHERNL